MMPTNEKHCPEFGVPVYHAQTRYGCDCSNADCPMNQPEEEEEGAENRDPDLADYSFLD